MGQRDAHLQQARANRDFAHQLVAQDARLSSPVAVQWAVTVAFYAALHSIEAHFATLEVHSQSHWDRTQNLRDYPVPDQVHAAYMMLKEYSEQGRYRLRTFSAPFVTETVLNRYLARVLQFAEP